MSSNTGKLTTPSGEGAYIEAKDDELYINKPITVESGFDTVLKRDVTNKALVIVGGTKMANSATLILRGIDETSYPTMPGSFAIRTRKADGEYGQLKGFEDDLTWNNKVIDSIYSFGNNYIQYTNGLAICWLFVSNTGTSAYTFTLPIAFKDMEYRCFGCDTGSARYSVAVQKLSTSSVNIYCGEGTWGVNVLAIGRWK